MNKESTIALLLVFLLFVVQPVLLVIGARKAYRRSGTLWGLLAFVINAGTMAFFESQHRSPTIADGADEVGTIMIISAIFILTILELLKNGSPSTRKELFRRGVFRIWSTISGGWLILCTFEIISLPARCYLGRCDLFSRAFFKHHASLLFDHLRELFRYREGVHRSSGTRVFSRSHRVLGG
jgi:hypothetical protein